MEIRFVSDARESQRATTSHVATGNLRISAESWLAFSFSTLIEFLEVWTNGGNALGKMKSSLNNAITTLQEKIAKISNEIDKLKKEISALQKQLKPDQKKINEIAGNLKSRYNERKLLLRALSHAQSALQN